MTKISARTPRSRRGAPLASRRIGSASPRGARASARPSPQPAERSRVSRRRHRRIRRRTRRVQEVVQRHAGRQRDGLRAHPAPRSDARKPDGGVAGEADRDAGARGAGWHARARQSRLRHPAERGSGHQASRASRGAAAAAARIADGDRFLPAIAGGRSAGAGDRHHPVRDGQPRHARPRGHQGRRRAGDGADAGIGGARPDAAQRHRHRAWSTTS